LAKRRTVPAKNKTTDPEGNVSIITPKGNCGKKTKRESLKNKAAE